MHGFDGRNIPVISHILGIFFSVFVQAVLERVHCSAAYHFIWSSIPSSSYFSWIKMFLHYKKKLHYRMFLHYKLFLHYKMVYITKCFCNLRTKYFCNLRTKCFCNLRTKCFCNLRTKYFCNLRTKCFCI